MKIRFLTSSPQYSLNILLNRVIHKVDCTNQLCNTLSTFDCPSWGITVDKDVLHPFLQAFPAAAGLRNLQSHACSPFRLLLLGLSTLATFLLCTDAIKSICLLNIWVCRVRVKGHIDKAHSDGEAGSKGNSSKGNNNNTDKLKKLDVCLI